MYTYVTTNYAINLAYINTFTVKELASITIAKHLLISEHPRYEQRRLASESRLSQSKYYKERMKRQRPAVLARRTFTNHRKIDNTFALPIQAPPEVCNNLLTNSEFMCQAPRIFLFSLLLLRFLTLIFLLAGA